MTKKKRRLPPDMAFPVSVSRLKEKLAGVPQLAEIKIEYSYYKGMSLRRLRKTKYGRAQKAVESTSIEILTASYVLWAIGLTNPNFCVDEDSSHNTYTNNCWSIWLRAISLDVLKDVRDLLENDGYAKLAEWFKNTNSFAGSIGNHRLAISFDGKQLIYRQHDRY
ncbi:hypothetical protein KF913_07780 [Candidatus Obscuribacterales bacterium]|nr:hypothetical protein [Candidatus Obscuribacterales bacterium]